MLTTTPRTPLPSFPSIERKEKCVKKIDSIMILDLEHEIYNLLVNNFQGTTTIPE